MLRHEYSWSYSRFRLFTKCKRAYFFHYYASWEGWDQYSDDRTQHIYLLKNLKKTDLWIENIFKNSLIETLCDGKYNLIKLERKAFSKLNRDLCELRESVSKGDLKKISLFESYYHIETPMEIEFKARNRLSFLFANFAGIQESISEIPYLSLKNFKRPVSFFLDGIKVWCAPDIIFEHKGEIVVIDLFFKDPAKSSDWAFKTAVDAIYAESKWPGRVVELNSIFLHEKDYPQIDISRNRKEVRNIMISSSREMMGMTKLDTVIEEKSFIPIGNRDSCGTCVYKEMCW